MLDVIRKPLVTEKNSQLGDRGVYVFEVDRSANKLVIKKAVEKFFGVKVLSVKTMICRDKERFTRVGLQKKRYWKKALVRLAPGEKITLFEGA